MVASSSIENGGSLCDMVSPPLASCASAARFPNRAVSQTGTWLLRSDNAPESDERIIVTGQPIVRRNGPPTFPECQKVGGPFRSSALESGWPLLLSRRHRQKSRVIVRAE